MAEQQVVVLTGAAGGIGSVAASLYAASGATLLLVDRDRGRLEALAGNLGGRAAISVSSLESPKACHAAMGGLQRIDALVHLAGIYETDSLDAASRSIWDRTLAVNLTSAFDLAAAARPKMQAGGRMVFVSSIAFRRGSFDHIAYSASKGGIVGLVRALARHLAPDILVNGVAPGIIDTAMPAAVIAERGEALLREIPLRRWGSAGEVVRVIRFLTGPDSTYVTGQIINVDGGIVNG